MNHSNFQILMKKVIFSIIIFFTFVISSQAQSNSGAVAAWYKTTHDFKEIPQGVPVSVEFKFKNVGKKPLVISKVNVSCGCTTPFYTKKPIPPGQYGKIKAQFNAKAAGNFNKKITVVTNDTKVPNKQLTIKGTVVAK